MLFANARFSRKPEKYQNYSLGRVAPCVLLGAWKAIGAQFGGLGTKLGGVWWQHAPGGGMHSPRLLWGNAVGECVAWGNVFPHRNLFVFPCINTVGEYVGV